MPRLELEGVALAVRPLSKVAGFLNSLLGMLKLVRDLTFAVMLPLVTGN